jgi:TolB-like protein/Flp pilus assembly protein TadD
MLGATSLMIEPSHTVFLSYASQDAQAAQKVSEALRAAGIKTFLDQSELRGGDAWDQKIRREIHDCTLFIPIVSQHTQARLEGYFRHEWKLAIERTHRMAEQKMFLVPVVIDGTGDQDAFVPEGFRAVQWTRLPGGETTPVFVDRIKRLLSPLSATPDTARPNTSVALGKPVRASPTSMPVLLALAVVVLIAALAYRLVGKFWVSGHPGSSASSATSRGSAGPATVAFAPPPHSIAVLPFENMSGDANQQYFSDGITEELLNSLARLNDLQVAARTSSFSFRGQNVDILTIAHKLNVAAVLEGSVRRAGNTVRITAQLINAADGFHLWSQTYDRKLTDILKVQADVATAVAQQLEVKLVGGVEARIELGGTRNPEAHDAYLRGKQLEHKNDSDFHEANWRGAIAAYDQAISLDSGYTLAYVAKASMLTLLIEFFAKPEEVATLNIEAAETAAHAVALAPELGPAHLELGEVRAWVLLNFAAAAPEFERALALAPGDSTVQARYSGFAMNMGHADAAVKAARRAVTLDPENVEAYVRLGQILESARRYDEAFIVLNNAQARYPESVFIRSKLANLLIATGNNDRARKLCETLPTLDPDGDIRSMCLALTYHALGRPADAERELERLKSSAGDGGATGYAIIYAQWGDKPAALQWLEKAEQLHDISLQGLKVDWELDPIRNEPQFKALVARMHFPP